LSKCALIHDFLITNKLDRKLNLFLYKDIIIFGISAKNIISMV